MLGKTQPEISQIVSSLPQQVVYDTTSISNVLKNTNITKQLNQPLLKSLVKTQALGAISTLGGQGIQTLSTLSRGIVSHFGIDALGRSIYSLFNPSGKYALPQVSARPISGANMLV